MKFKYYILALFAAVACSPVNPVAPGMDALKAEPSFVACTKEGGSVIVEIDSKGDWTIPNADTVKTFCTINPTSGTAGKTKVTFKFKPNTEASEKRAEVFVTSGGKTQILKVSLYGTGQEEIVKTNSIDVSMKGKVKAVKGSVVEISNTVYGNYYVKDDKGKIYVYGTLDKNGASKNFSSLGIEEGDIVTVKGVVGEYKGKAQLVNVTVIDHVKSLIKVEGKNLYLPHDTTGFTVEAVFKGDLFEAKSDDSWISAPSIGVTSDGKAKASFGLIGVNDSKFNPKKGKVTLIAKQKNKKGEMRTDEIQMNVVICPQPLTPADYTVATVEEFLAKKPAKRGAYYKVTGTIKQIRDKDYGNLILEDGNGHSFYVYGLTSKHLGIDAGNDKSFRKLNLKEKDVITVIGTREKYERAKNKDEIDQMCYAFYEGKHIN